MNQCSQCGQTHPTHVACPSAFEETVAPETFPQTMRGYAADATVQEIPPGSTLKGIGQKRQPPQTPSPGMNIGGYILEECLGRGGMGEVWKARQPVIKSVVAIKILDARLAMDGGIVTRFVREAQAVNEIRHKNLVDIFSFGEITESRRPYLVMEFLEGQTLTHRLREGPLPLKEILPILEQICEAMQAAHDRGIIHRDLKPDNIFLVGQKGQKPFVKILDFGIAKLKQPDGSGLTQTGEVFGTPEYMAPEQCMGAKNVDARSDIYALGIILYEMISGRTPFGEPGEKRGHIWMKHVTEEPPPLSQFSPRPIPKGLEEVLKKCLSKEPDTRFQKAKDLFLAFEEVLRRASEETLRALPSQAPSAPPGKTLPTESVRKESRNAPVTTPRTSVSSLNPFVLLGVGGVLVAAILFLAYQYVSSEGAPPSAPPSSVPPPGEPSEPAPLRAEVASPHPPREEPASAPSSLPAPEEAPPSEEPEGKANKKMSKGTTPGAKARPEAVIKPSPPPPPPREAAPVVEKKQIKEGTLNPWEK